MGETLTRGADDPHMYLDTGLGSPSRFRAMPVRPLSEHEWCDQFGGLLTALALTVTRELQRLNVDTAWFCTREGVLLQTAFARVAQACGERWHGRLLPVSRMATFGPAHVACEWDALAPLRQQFGAMTVAELLISLQLETSPGTEAAACVWSPAGWEAFQQRVDRPLLAARRQILRDYLQQLGMADRVVLVDIGWRGSIQDNLALVSPERYLAGVYLALDQLIRPPLANVSKRAAGVDARVTWGRRQRRMIRLSPGIEMACNAPGGSVIGYARDETGVAPVYRAAPGEDPVWQRHTQRLQRAALRSVPAWVARLQTCSDSHLAGVTQRLHNTLVSWPARAVADGFAQLEHDESFGLGRSLGPDGDLPWQQRAQAVRHPRRAWRALLGHRWPQASLVTNGPAWSCAAYNALRSLRG